MNCIAHGRGWMLLAQAEYGKGTGATPAEPVSWLRCQPTRRRIAFVSAIRLETELYLNARPRLPAPTMRRMASRMTAPRKATMISLIIG
jgi:hypothetical protein